MSKTKVCSECKQELDASEFYPRKNTKIGLSCCCKTCHKTRGKIAKAKINAKPKLIPEFKKCSKCGETYPASMFVKDNDRICGLASWCKTCISSQRSKTIDARRAHDREYYAKNKDKARAYRKANAAHIKETEKLNKAKRRHLYWAYNTIKNHVSRGFEVLIKTEELETLAKKTTVCPICGIALKWEFGKTASNSPTLDRINNGNKICLDNIWILCHRCNTMKRDLPMHEYVKHCELVLSKFGSVYDQDGSYINPEKEIAEEA